MSATICRTAAEAVAGIEDGSTVLVGGFGMAGMPVRLIDALIEQGATDLTVVSNNAGNGDTGLAALLKAGRVRKIICSFPRQTDSHVFDGLYHAGKIELELTPQGKLRWSTVAISWSGPQPGLGSIDANLPLSSVLMFCCCSRTSPDSKACLA